MKDTAIKTIQPQRYHITIISIAFRMLITPTFNDVD